MTELRLQIGGGAGYPAKLDPMRGVLELEEVSGVDRSALEHLLILEGFRGVRFLERTDNYVRFRVIAPTRKR